MLTGDLVRVRTSKQRIVPLYLDRSAERWLEVAESLLLLFREGIGMSRGEIESEIDALFGGGGKATQVHRGLAKVLEDRAEFEVVADVPPEVVREKVFTAAALARRHMRAGARRAKANLRSQRDHRLGCPRIEAEARCRHGSPFCRSTRRESIVVVRRYAGTTAHRPLQRRARPVGAVALDPREDRGAK